MYIFQFLKFIGNKFSKTDFFENMHKIELFIIKFCILWILTVGPLVIFCCNHLEMFIAEYLSPDRDLSSPKFIISLAFFGPIMISAIWLATYPKWKFPMRFLKIYLMLFILHFLIYYFSTRFILIDMQIEDSFLEWGTAILALLASVLFFYSGLIGSRFSFILCLAWLTFALEEISWGQRIFDFDSPQFFMTYNLQYETNLHNFFINPHWRWFYNGFNLFLFGFFTWFRKIPLLFWLYKIQGVKDILRVSDKYGLWMIPFFSLSALQYMGAEFIEEQWGFFGALLSFLLLIDLLSLKKSTI
jgi:hypothetical protein